MRIRVSRELLIGRSADGEGALGGDPEISRRHAIVRREGDGGLSIEDLGSMNGTLVNGEPVADHSPLGPGDRIELGRSVLEVREVGSRPGSAEPERGTPRQSVEAGLPSTAELGIGTRVAGYRVEEVLGRGGMGVVYRVVDDRLGRSAALKAIAPEQVGDEEFRRRFISESRAAAAIDHPNVLPVYEAGEEDGVLFLVTRLVDGADLGVLLDQDGAMEVDRALGLSGQIGVALDAAHARGLVHRDVKPANVLVARDPGPGTEHCYLTDFGLAQQGDRRSRLTTTGQFVGTLDYIAPEQIQGEKVDGRADVYALAALFYECATGVPPFVRDSQPALLFAHMSDPPPPISAKLDGAPQALDRVIAKAMAKAPGERYATCTEFVEAARAALAGDAPPSAPPPPALEGAAPGPRAAETAVEGQVPVETVHGEAPPASAPPGEPVALDSGRSGRPPGRQGVGWGSPRRRAVMLGAGIVALALVAVLAWVVLGFGGGEEAGGGSTAALRLSTETISLSRAIGGDAERLAESVGANGPTGDLTAEFESARRQASTLEGRATSELSGDDPGRADLERAARDLGDSSAALARVAAAPAAGASRAEAREAKQSMSAALTGLDRALAAQQSAFAAEGERGAASSVGDSLIQLRDSRRQLIAPFDNLIRAV